MRNWAFWEVFFFYGNGAQFASDEVDEARKIVFLANLTLTYIILKVIRVRV